VPGGGVPSGVAGAATTFALACGSAAFFLFLRCHGTGRPFGPHSRAWALLVIGVTGLVSTAAAVVSVAVVDHLPFAFVGLGMVAPSGLWLAEIRNRQDDRRGLLRDLSTLWLSRLLARMQEGMAEDRITWCEERVDSDWGLDELGSAARFYQEYVRERLTPAERRRSRTNAQLNAIEARLTVIQLIESGAGKTKLAAALQAARATKDVRYRNNLPEPARMAEVLRHDAERDLIRLLGSAYGAGLYRMPVFIPRWTPAAAGSRCITR
jgi:hypothetical protein